VLVHALLDSADDWLTNKEEDEEEAGRHWITGMSHPHAVPAVCAVSAVVTNLQWWPACCVVALLPEGLRACLSGPRPTPSVPRGAAGSEAGDADHSRPSSSAGPAVDGRANSANRPTTSQGLAQSGAGAPLCWLQTIGVLAAGQARGACRMSWTLGVQMREPQGLRAQSR
jgi:hypothetical protein